LSAGAGVLPRIPIEPRARAVNVDNPEPDCRPGRLLANSTENGHSLWHFHSQRISSLRCLLDTTPKFGRPSGCFLQSGWQPWVSCSPKLPQGSELLRRRLDCCGYGWERSIISGTSRQLILRLMFSVFCRSPRVCCLFGVLRRTICAYLGWDLANGWGARWQPTPWRSIHS